MERINKAEQQYKQSRKDSRKEYLKGQFESKSFADEWRGTFYLCIAVGVFFQIASLLTAITLPASWGYTVSNSWVVGFGFAAIILVILEIFKRIFVSKAVKNGLQFKKWVSVGMFSAVCLSIVSICFSTFGTPVLIREFGAAPSLQDTTGMQSSYLANVAAVKGHWSGLIDEANGKAKATHDQNSWKGKTTRKARPVVLGYQQQAQKYQDSLQTQLSIIAQDHKNELLRIEKENQEVLSQDKINKASVGFILGFITFGFELLFIATTFFAKYYDYREMLEIEQEEGVFSAPVVDINRSSDEKKKMLIRQAHALRAEDMSLRAIGRELEISHTQVANLLKEAVN